MHHPYRNPKVRHWYKPGIGPVFPADVGFDYLETEDDIAITEESSDQSYLIIER